MSDLFGADFSSFSGSKNTEEFDFDSAVSAFPDISLDDVPTFPSSPGGDTRTTSGFSFHDFDTAPSQSPVRVTGDDALEKFENEFPEINVPSKQGPTPKQTYPPATLAPQPQPSGFSSTPILTQHIDGDEPNVIRQWREKQQEEIRVRDEASKRRREDTVATAERDIEEFYENYAKKKERSIRDNKNTEAEFVADMQASLSAGTTWERICNLIELQNSQSKTIARTGPGTTDLSRFKEVLLRLKREGPTAPGAAGY